MLLPRSMHGRGIWPQRSAPRALTLPPLAQLRQRGRGVARRLERQVAPPAPPARREQDALPCRPGGGACGEHTRQARGSCQRYSHRPHRPSWAGGAARSTPGVEEPTATQSAEPILAFPGGSTERTAHKGRQATCHPTRSPGRSTSASGGSPGAAPLRRTMVPGGTRTTRSGPAAPCMSEPPPGVPGSALRRAGAPAPVSPAAAAAALLHAALWPRPSTAMLHNLRQPAARALCLLPAPPRADRPPPAPHLKCTWRRKAVSELSAASPSQYTCPPRPPLPPLGPPLGTNFSLRHRRAVGEACSRLPHGSTPPGAASRLQAGAGTRASPRRPRAARPRPTS